MLTSFYQLKKLNNQFRWTLYLNSLPSQNYLLTSFLYQSNRDMSLCAKHTDANAGRTGYNIIRVYEFTCMCEYSECSHRFTVMPSSQHGVCVGVCVCTGNDAVSTVRLASVGHSSESTRRTDAGSRHAAVLGSIAQYERLHVSPRWPS